MLKSLVINLYPGDVYFQNGEGLRITSDRMDVLKSQSRLDLAQAITRFETNPSAGNYANLENAMLKYQDSRKNWDRIVIKSDSVDANEEVE